MTSPGRRDARMNVLRDMIFVERANITRTQNIIKNIRFTVLPELRTNFHQLRAGGARPSAIFAARRNIQAQVDEIEELQDSKNVTRNRIRGLQDRIERLRDIEF